MTQTYAGATASDGTDTVVAPQRASHVEFAFRGTSIQSTEHLAFTVSPAALAETPWQVTVIVSPTVGGAEREPTDEELLQGLRELMAEDERELGPIPEEARAEVERQWRD
jgi:hypothetical protein